VFSSLGRATGRYFLPFAAVRRRYMVNGVLEAGWCIVYRTPLTQLNSYVKGQFPEYFNAREKLFALDELTDALKCLHEEGFVHQQLSCKNIFLVPDGHGESTFTACKLAKIAAAHKKTLGDLDTPKKDVNAMREVIKEFKFKKGEALDRLLSCCNEASIDVLQNELRRMIRWAIKNTAEVQRPP